MYSCKIFRYTALFLLVLYMPAIIACSKKLTKSEKKIAEDAMRKDITDIADNRSENNNKLLINYSGNYRLTIPEFKGFLTISFDKKTGKISGTIKFDAWGKGVPEPLKNIKINNKKIYFIRSIVSSDEMKRYGSSRLFKQKFFGAFNKDGSVIKGFFVETGTETNWRAEKMIR